MAALEEDGTFGIVLLVLLIVLGVCLFVIALVTCYLYNVFNCYDRIRLFRKRSEISSQSDFQVIDTPDNEADLQTEASPVRAKITKRLSPELPILRISDIERKRSIRKPRPDSTLVLGQGRLTFALKYIEETNFLHVHLINGRQITLPTGELATMPTVKVRLGEQLDEEKQSSPDDTPNPEFDEVLSFRMHELALGDTVLNFTVWDSDTNMFKALIGFVRIPLAHFVDSLLRPGGTGPITREINLNPDADLPSRSNGEILISLSYTAELDKLIVAVLKCRDVDTTDDVTDLFTSVSLCAKKEELAIESTAYIDKFHDHVFNHMITFEPFMNQDKVTKDNVSIKITLNSRTLADEDLVIGEAHIGPNTTEEGILHWNEMVAHTRTAVAQWHRLIF